MRRPSVSIIFRALNEEKWFADALQACQDQSLCGPDVEIILVDSGSTDGTLEIARRFGCKIVRIKKEDFSFGRSLNYGCRAASGDYLVFISAHCVPSEETWLENLIAPLKAGIADYVYGRQLGHDVSRFSEHQIFAQYFPETSKLPQDGYFINNANSAMLKSVWQDNPFDEDVTGLEDMVLAQELQKRGRRIGYVAEAPVLHIHEESFNQTWTRYYREALTLHQIMPDMHFHFGDFLRFFAIGVFHDAVKARKAGKFLPKFGEIFLFRFMQYWGTYRGHNQKRALSRVKKDLYYYPKSSPARSPEPIYAEPPLGGTRNLKNQPSETK